MKILVIGAYGQLGRELVQQGPALGFEIDAADIDRIDITDAGNVAAFMEKSRPDMVINGAAYTAVDRAETEIDAAFAVNRDGPAILADACNGAEIPLIHVSTDFVFDGEKGAPYTETDPISPIGVYGRSKADGEAEVRNRLDSHLIVRTAWLYGVWGANFVKTMIRLAREREELRVVADQQGCPTSAEDLAGALLKMAQKIEKGDSIQWGTYHYCGAGVTTWHEFAQKSIGYAGEYLSIRVKSVHPIPASDYPTPAKRPPYSAMDCSRIEQHFGVRALPWEERLKRTIGRMAQLDQWE